MAKVNKTVNSELGQDAEIPAVENPITNVEDLRRIKCVQNANLLLIVFVILKKRICHQQTMQLKKKPRKLKMRKPGEDEEDKKAKYNLEEVVEYTELKLSMILLNLILQWKLNYCFKGKVKTSIDIKEKNEMISQFCMLDEEEI